MLNTQSPFAGCVHCWLCAAKYLYTILLFLKQGVILQAYIFETRLLFSTWQYDMYSRGQTKFTFTVPYNGTVKTIERCVQQNGSRTLIERSKNAVRSMD